MGVLGRIKHAVKKVAAFIMAFPLIIKVLLILSLLVTVASFIADLYEMITAENTPTKIYEDLEIEDVAELIQIKGNKDTGYYLDFVDDIDTKLTDLVKDLDNVPTDISFLKKLIQAEVVTKFPNLGGEIPEGESGFQGVIDVKRVTPNKEVGELKNTGQGESHLLEPETSYSDVSLTPKEEEIKSWQAGKQLVLYKDSYVYDNEENVWIKREKDSKYVVISRNDEVTYEGDYKKVEDKLNDTVTFYVKVKSGDVSGYIESKNINIRSSNLDKEENNANETATKQKVNVSSRAPGSSREKEVVGEEDKEYRIAIAAGHNNTNDTGAASGDLVEEELTIKVAEKVEELVNEKYENVTVIQTGSTSSNPGGIKVGDRKKLAREANPDLCIQIHFNAADSADGNGVEVIYKQGDGYSQQLAEILTDSISSSMGLKNRGAGSDIERCAVGSLGIIENYATSGFPSVVTEGGFLTGNEDADVIRNGGVEKYAQGIVEGIKTYLESDHSGLTAVSDGTTEITTSIESRIVNMKYLSPNELEEMKNSGNVKEATKYFTLNEDNRLVTLTWAQNEDGSVEVRENGTMDFRTALQKYHMPFEYLLYYYIDTDYREFSEELADIVLDSEIVITLQDNVTTTQTLEDTEVKVETSTNIGSAQGLAHDWAVDESKHKETITETCSTKTDITYVETWCVKTYKDNSFSEKVLNMGDQDEIIVNVPGQVTYNEGATTRGSEEIAMSAFRGTGVQDENGNEIGYTYIERHRIATTINNLMNTYDSGGDMKTEGVTNKYVDLYIKESMNDRMREGFFFKIVKKNEKTANLLDLTKYLMFMASNTNYGVTEFDFSVYELTAFNNIDGSFGDWDGTGNQQDFIEAVAPYAIIDMEQHQIYASVTIAQAIIESGWGKDNIAIQYKNFFGMKAGGAGANEFWSGESVTLNASEGGQSAFRVYDSLKNSIYDHGRNFHVTPTYASHGVLDCIPQNLGPKEQLRRIALSGYAVYSDGSISRPDGVRTYDVYLYEEFIQKYDLEKYDSMTSEDVAEMFGGNAQIVEIAKSKLGCPYVWGATGPNSFDCSGFVQWTYAQAGISLPRTTYDYRPYIGTSKDISWSEAQPGDIVWREQHMGIYLGDDKYIHAPHTGDVVKISGGASSSFTHVFRIQ